MNEPPLPPSALTSGDTLPFRRLLDEAMVWTRRSFHSIFWPFALPLAAAYAVVALFQVRFMSRSLLALPEPTPDLMGSFYMAMLVSLLIALAAALVYAAMTGAAVARLTGRDASPKAWLLFMLRPGVLGTLVLMVLALIPAYLCCGLPLLYVGPLLSLTIPAMVLEGHRGSAALGRSARLIGPNPLRDFPRNPLVKAFLLFLVVFVIYFAVNLLITGPLQIAMQWRLFRDLGAAQGTAPTAPEPWVLWLQVPGTALSTLVTMAVWLYASFGLGLLFLDVRERQEATGLEDAIRRLDEERGSATPGGEKEGR